MSAKVMSWIKRPKSRGVKIVFGIFVFLAVVGPVTTAYTIKKINENYAKTTAEAAAEVLGSTTRTPVNTAPVVASEQSTKPKKPTAKKPAAAEAQPTAEVPVEAMPAQPYPDTYPGDLKSAVKGSTFDQWGMKNRESVSYAAWKVQETFGNMPTQWGGLDKKVTARQWPALADEAKIARSMTPKVHSVGVVNDLAVWVEAVNGDKVTVSFYDWGDSGAYGIWKDVPATNFSTYIYFQ